MLRGEQRTDHDWLGAQEMFRLQKVSNYGTATPAIARTFAQGCDLLQHFASSEQQISAAKSMLLELQRHALRCTEIRDELADEMKSAMSEADELQKLQSGRGVVAVPGVGDLQSRAESFVQSLKLGVAETGNLPGPFYGVSFSHYYHRFGAWSLDLFGPDDEFTKMVQSWEPFVKRVLDMRNAVDHPKS
jgi:hypothetical protein